MADQEVLDEIERLHSFFVDWYTAQVDESSFPAFEEALASEFEMISPDGRQLNRRAVVEYVENSRGTYAPGAFDIDIKAVETVRDLGEYTTVRYEEWQRTPDGTDGRISTVLFRDATDAPGGLLWEDLHETRLET